MVRKLLLTILGALVLVFIFILVAALTKRAGLTTSITRNFLSSATPSPAPLVASGQVLAVNKASNSLRVRFDAPPMFRGKVQDVEIDCPPNQSFVNTITYNIKTKKPPVVSDPQPTNQLLFQIANPTNQDVITGQCATASCTAFTASCILTRSVYLR